MTIFTSKQVWIGEVSLSCNEPEIPTDDRNLVVRAAHALQDRDTRWTRARVLSSNKRIPTKAGLGGASSNAAVSLLALARLWEIDADDETSFEIAADIGSRCSVFSVGWLRPGNRHRNNSFAVAGCRASNTLLSSNLARKFQLLMPTQHSIPLP